MQGLEVVEWRWCRAGCRPRRPRRRRHKALQEQQLSLTGDTDWLKAQLKTAKDRCACGGGGGCGCGGSSGRDNGCSVC